MKLTTVGELVKLANEFGPHLEIHVTDSAIEIVDPASKASILSKPHPPEPELKPDADQSAGGSV